MPSTKGTTEEGGDDMVTNEDEDELEGVYCRSVEVSWHDVLLTELNNML